LWLKITGLDSNQLGQLKVSRKGFAPKPISVEIGGAN
jgi:hypothetical protein